MRDIRLYFYDNGKLVKEGISDRDKFRPHRFDSVVSCLNQIDFLRNKYPHSWPNEVQFVIVEYFDKYKSKIIEVI